MRNDYRTNDTFISKGGNTVRYEDLFKGIYQAVEVARHRGLRSDMAEDVYQDAALKALQSSKNFDETRGASVKTFGGRIASTKLIDNWHRTERFGEIFSDCEVTDEDGERLEPKQISSYRGDEFEADRELRTNEAMDKIGASLGKLGEIDMIIISQTIDGLKPRKIAENLNMTADAVSVRLHRIRKFLKGDLSDLLSEYGMTA